NATFSECKKYPHILQESKIERHKISRRMTILNVKNGSAVPTRSISKCELRLPTEVRLDQTGVSWRSAVPDVLEKAMRSSVQHPQPVR
ncbi:unnamed protein product, partial [Nesidiocoris tenuis]